MKILITPEDIIKRCLWTNYKKFALKNKNKAQLIEIVEKNELTTINEKDAFVVGLLKVIETDDLVHRFRLNIEEFVKIKTTVNKNRVIISKSALLKEINEFILQFPEYYKTTDYYQSKIDAMKEFALKLIDDVNSLEIIEILFKEKNFIFVNSKDINKLIKYKND